MQKKDKNKKIITCICVSTIQFAKLFWYFVGIIALVHVVQNRV